MSIIHMLNIADLAFMAGGVGVALLMIVVGARDSQRRDDETGRRPARGRHKFRG